jgi:hypothetical protein
MAILAPGGTIMLIEPFANDKIEENLNPVEQLNYTGSCPIRPSWPGLATRKTPNTPLPPSWPPRPPPPWRRGYSRMP